jgi:hypothetical protein
VPPGVACQDEAGRLWDILWMLLCAVRRGQTGGEVRFALHVRNDNREGTSSLVRLKALCGPGDDGAPCMDLPDLVRRVEQACGRAIDNDERFASLSQALANLTVLDRYAAHRHLRRDVLEDLLVRCFDRACFTLPASASVPEDQQAGVVAALLTLAEVVQRSDREELDRGLFAQYVRTAARESTVPFLRGAFLGMLAEIRELTAEQLAAEVSGLARAPGDVMVTAGDFLDGVLSASRTSILLGADALIAAVDELLRAAGWEPFLVMLPKLRAAFERLHERDRDSLAARVAERYGLAEAEAVTELRTSVGAAARLARIDRQVAEIMEWLE